MTELTVTQEKIVPLMKEIDLQVMETVVRNSFLVVHVKFRVTDE